MLIEGTSYIPYYTNAIFNQSFMKYKVLLLSKSIDLSESDLDRIKNKRIED